ncbi:MAG: hypothetical protein O7F73_03375, partial [Gammaproteobacteria bacterium]|nr:hypothetical protein [Gammaproteobacteria bacterium]
MRHRRNTAWIYALCVALTATLLTQSKPALAVQPSSLSKWLSKQAVPDLRDRLGRHPRYENQRVAVVSTEGDALSAAIVTVLLRSFPGKYGIQLQSWQDTVPVPDAAAFSIDGLRCAGTAGFDYLLQVSATRGPAGGDEVQLQLAPVQDKSAVTDGWRWAGKFSKAERSYLQQRAESGSRDGSLVAPW